MGRIISCMRTVFVGLALAGFAGVTVAQTTQKADESRIQKLVADLGAEAWKVREGATKELAAIGPAARPALTKATTSDDPEVVQRAKAILSQIARACFDAASKQIPKSLLWSCSVKDGVTGRISIKDGVAYVAGFDRALHAVDIKTGKEKWSQAQLSDDAAMALAQALVSDKAALAVLVNGDVTGLDISSGKVNWKYKRELPANPPPNGAAGGGPVPAGGAPGAGVIARPGIVVRPIGRIAPAVVGSTLYLPQEDKVVLLDTETGKKQKEIQLPSPSMGTPIVNGGQMVIYLADRTVRGFSLSDGSEIWNHAGGMSAGSVACWEGKVYFVGDPMTMYALDCATGKELWQCSMMAEETGAPGGIRPRPAIVVMGFPMGCPLTIKDGTLYTLQGLNLVAVDAKDGKKKWQRQIDLWPTETPDAALRVQNQVVISRPPMMLAQTASPFLIDGNIACINGGQLGIYAVGLDDGLPRWAFRTNMAVVDMVLLDGVLYFGTSQRLGMAGPVRPMPPQPPPLPASQTKPAGESKQALPEGLHALKVK